MEEEEEEEGTRKRQGAECERDVVEPVASKKPRNPARGDEVDEKEEQDVMPWLTLDDDTVMELSELLDSSDAASSSSSSVSSTQQLNFKVKFVENPYMTPVIFQSSSAYVTINGNEESCGSSFSDTDSTLMASVDMGSFRGALRKLSRELNEDSGGAWISDVAEEEVVAVARGWMEGNDYVKDVFVKSLSGCCDFVGTPPAQFENDDGDGDGDDKMWVNFLGEDLFGGAW